MWWTNQVERGRNAHAAKRFFRKLLKGQGSPPWQLATDELKRYALARSKIAVWLSLLEQIRPILCLGFTPATSR